MAKDDGKVALKEVPFFVLDVPCDADRRTVVAAAEDRSFLMDPDLCAQAQSILLNPAKRLSAEMDWFPDTDRATLGKIKGALEMGRPMMPVTEGGLSRLNAALYNLTLMDTSDRNRLANQIKQVDTCFTELDLDALTAKLNELRTRAKLAQTGRQEVERELSRKRGQIRREVGRKLASMQEMAAMSMMTFLAVSCFGSSRYSDGAVLADAVTEYELRVQPSLERHTEKIRTLVKRCDAASGAAQVSAILKEISTELSSWAGLATPMNVRAQSSGVPYDKGREMFRMLRELSVRLHNEKQLTAQALELSELLKRMFSGNADIQETLGKDRKDLEGQLAAKNILETLKDELEQLAELTQSVEKWTSWDVPVKLEQVKKLVTSLNGKLKELIKADKDARKLRELVFGMGRSVYVDLHNKKERTDLACSLAELIVREFSDDAEMASKAREDKRQLDEQQRLKEILGLTGRGSSSSGSSRGSSSFGSGSSGSGYVSRTPSRDPAVERSNALFDGKRQMEKNDRQAITTLTKAADLGSTEAMRLLAQIYRKGSIVPRDIPEAEKWLNKASDRGDTEAMLMMGRAYEQGDGVRRDPGEAFRWYRRAADAGSGDGRYMVANCYRNGIGTPKDRAAAARTFKEGADRGDMRCMREYVACLEKGEGVQKDRPAARRMLIKLADKGDVASCARVGRMFEIGENGPRDGSEARKYYRKGAEAGDEECLLGMARTCTGGTSLEAAAFVERLKKDGFRSGAAQNALGVIHLHADTDDHLASARVCLRKAQELGHPEAAGNMRKLEEREAQKKAARRKEARRKLVRILAVAAAVVVLICTLGIVQYVQGKRAYEEGRYIQALVKLEWVSFLDRDLYRAAQYEGARAMVLEDRFDEALTHFDVLGETDLPEYHYAKAVTTVRSMQTGELQPGQLMTAVRDGLARAGSVGKATEHKAVLDLALSGDLAKAVDRAQDLTGSGASCFTEAQWTWLLMDLQDAATLEGMLRRDCIDANFADAEGNFTLNSVKAEVDGTSSGMTAPPEYAKSQKVEDVAALVRQCGSNRSGKILFVRSFKEFRGTPKAYIYEDLMDLLPADKRPGSLAEVEYVVVLEYSYRDSPTGDYMYGTEGIQELATVEIWATGSRKKVYTSGTVIGPDCPSSFMAYSAPAYKSGGIAKIGKLVYDAVSKYL